MTACYPPSLSSAASETLASESFAHQYPQAMELVVVVEPPLMLLRQRFDRRHDRVREAHRVVEQHHRRMLASPVAAAERVVVAMLAVHVNQVVGSGGGRVLLPRLGDEDDIVIGGDVAAA